MSVAPGLFLIIAAIAANLILLALILVPPLVGRSGPLGRDGGALDPERRAAQAAVVGGLDGSTTDDGVPTETYDRVVRVVAWTFILSTTAIVAATGLWPATQSAIYVLLAFAGLFVLVVHDLLPAAALGPAKFVVEGSVAITVATLLVALTGGVASPFFFAFPLIVGGAALVVSAPITLVLTLAASFGYVLAVLAGSTVGSLGPETAATVGVDLTALILLAYVAMVIARAQRRTRDAAIRLSTVDSLTGLFNRNFFFAAIDREIARSARSGRGFCLLMMDLDELKAINDRLGHFHGDRVLRGVGEVIAAGRPPDRHGRALRRRRVRRPPARDRSDRCVRPRREDPDRRRRDAHRRCPAASRSRPCRSASSSFPDDGRTRRRADHQRGRCDVRIQARRQGPRDGRARTPSDGPARRLRCSIAP